MSKLKKLVQTESAAEEFVKTLKYENLLMEMKQNLSKILKSETLSDKCMKLLEGQCSLAANCCHFSVDAKIQLKQIGLLAIGAELIDKPDLPDGLKHGLAKLMANICNQKESAAGCIEDPEIVASFLSCASREVNSERVKIQSVRAIRLISSLGNTFCTGLLKRPQAAFSLAQLWANGPSPCIDDDIITCLLNMCCIKTKCTAQIAKSGCAARILSEIVTYYQSAPTLMETSKVKSLFDILVVESQEFRSSLVIEGIIGKFKDILDLYKEEGLKNSIYVDILKVINCFAKDSFARCDLRDSGALNYLIDAFCDSKRESNMNKSIIQSFTWFEYDDTTLQVLLSHPNFLKVVSCHLESLSETMERMSCNNSSHATSKNVPDVSDVEDDLSFVRPDSPSLLRIHAMVESRSLQDSDVSTPLCKDFTNQAKFSWNANCVSPSYPGPGGSSPGNCASPGYSTRSSMPNSPGSSEFNYSGTPSLCNSFVPTDGLSVASTSSQASKRRKIDYTINEAVQKRYSCSLSNLSIEQKSGNTLLLILTPVSHKESLLPFLVRKDLIEALIKYYLTDPRNEGRVGRILYRLAQTRNFTEQLVDMEFHAMIWELCRVGCAITNIKCERCDKIHEMGCKVMDSFAGQVDSDFGMGILMHQIAITKSEERKMKYVCAAMFLIRMKLFRRKIFMDNNKLEFLIEGMNESFIDFQSEKINRLPLERIINAIMAFIPMSILSERLKDNRLSVGLENTMDNCCRLPTVKNEDTINYGNACLISRNVLSSCSEYYCGRFSGSFNESTHILTCPPSLNSQAFTFFLHYVHGCSNCISMPALDYEILLDLVDLGDRLLCAKARDFAVCRLGLHRNVQLLHQEIIVCLRLHLDNQIKDAILYAFRHLTTDQFITAMQRLYENKLLHCFVESLKIALRDEILK